MTYHNNSNQYMYIMEKPETIILSDAKSLAELLARGHVMAQHHKAGFMIVETAICPSCGKVFDNNNDITSIHMYCECRVCVQAKDR